MARTIENKIVSFTPSDSKTYGELIMMIVQTPRFVNGQNQSLNYEDLKKIQRVDNVIGEDKLKSEFKFEDSDYEFIKEKLNSPNFGWGFYHKDLIVFIEYINDRPIDEIKE